MAIAPPATLKTPLAFHSEEGWLCVDCRGHADETTHTCLACNAPLGDEWRDGHHLGCEVVAAYSCPSCLRRVREEGKGRCITCLYSGLAEEWKREPHPTRKPRAHVGEWEKARKLDRPLLEDRYDA
jgi:RNA polymerase subunit RPABC4/transcription elongation factor Spt4